MNRTYPRDDEARAAILELGQRLYARGFVAANGGNISVRVAEDAVWCTPAGVSKGFMAEEALVKLDLAGGVLAGTQPSSEAKLHLRVYRENTAVRAVVHAHPPCAAAFASAGLPLDTHVLEEAVLRFGAPGVPLAPYARTGSEALADGIAPFCRDYGAVLLEFHGAVTWAESAEEAWFRMESLEHCARVLLYRSLLGSKRHLSPAQLRALSAL